MSIVERAGQDHADRRPADRRAADPDPAGSADETPAGPRLFGRGLLYTVVWVAQVASGAVISPVLAHLMGAAEFGLLSTAIAVHQVLMVLAVLGLDRILQVRRAEDGHDGGARGLIATATVLAGLVTLVALVSRAWWAPLLGFTDDTGLTLATVLWTAPAGVVMVSLALLLAQDRLGAYALVSCLSAVGGQVFGITLLLGRSPTADVYAWGGVISQVLAAGLALWFTRPRWRGVLETTVVRGALRLGVPLMLSGLSVFVMDAGDRLVIQRLLGSAEVGRYQIAYTVGYVVVLLIVSTAGAWTPRIAAVTDPEGRRRLSARARDETYRILVPVLLGVTLGAPVMLRIVAPASFRPGDLVVVTFLVALAAFPVAASAATGRLLLLHNRTRPLATAAAVAAVVNIGLNVVLVGRFGIAAAAAVTVAAFAVQAAWQGFALPADARPPRTSGRLLVLVAATVVGCVSSLLLPDTAVVRWACFAAAIACLPWFWLRLRAARAGEDA